MGYVYSFEVAGDSSFVAAGVATHNSKIAAGEMLLPGAGFEAQGARAGERALDASEIGTGVYQTSLRMLGITGDPEPEGASWAREMATQRLIDMGLAIRTKAVYVDERSRLTAVAAAATKGNNPIHVKALTDAEFRQTERPRALDTERLNAMLGAADRARGYLAYVNAETGQVQTFVRQFDSGLYQRSVSKLQAARSLSKEYVAMGYGAPGAMYSPTDRLRVLMNASPFGDEWRVEYKKAEQLYFTGSMSMAEEHAFRETTRMHEKMGLPFEMHTKRFRPGDLMNPAERHVNLSYNDNVRAAADYSLPERALGGVWQGATSLRSPLHSRFFGNYSPAELYEQRVLLGRGFQSWTDPIGDFALPYARGLAAAEDPVQGALSFGLGGATFAGPLGGILGGAVGAAYGTARMIYEGGGGGEYVPSHQSELRRLEQGFDRLRYYRARRLYDATGSRQYLDEMQRTAYGWTQEGLSGTGWAKDRRRGSRRQGGENFLLALQPVRTGCSAQRP